MKLGPGLFQQVVFQLDAKQIKSSAYHPESRNAFERFHSTLRGNQRKYVKFVYVTLARRLRKASLCCQARTNLTLFTAEKCTSQTFSEDSG